MWQGKMKIRSIFALLQEKKICFAFLIQRCFSIHPHISCSRIFLRGTEECERRGPWALPWGVSPLQVPLRPSRSSLDFAVSGSVLMLISSWAFWKVWILALLLKSGSLTSPKVLLSLSGQSWYFSVSQHRSRGDVLRFLVSYVRNPSLSEVRFWPSMPAGLPSQTPFTDTEVPVPPAQPCLVPLQWGLMRSPG